MIATSGAACLSSASTLLFSPRESAAAAAFPPFGLSSLFGGQQDRRQLEVCLVAVLRVRYWAQTVARSLEPEEQQQPKPKTPQLKEPEEKEQGETAVLDGSSSVAAAVVDNTNDGGGGAGTTGVDSDEDELLAQQRREILLQQRQKSYLEARLGAKAILTGKVGGGASMQVYNLASLKVDDCLRDLEYYYRKIGRATAAPSSGTSTREGWQKTGKEVNDLVGDFRESLASLVEFDGMDTLDQASPRSSLTLSRYDENKATYVRRILKERVAPAASELLRRFPPDAVQRSEDYVRQYYSSEVFVP